MTDLMARLHEFIEDLANDPVEGRVVEFVVREVGNGRRLDEVLKDPYVRNRLSEERLAHVLENPAVLDAFQKQITESFGKRDFGFGDR